MNFKSSPGGFLAQWFFVAIAVLILGCRSERNEETIDIRNADFSSTEDYRSYDETLQQLAEGQPE